MYSTKHCKITPVVVLASQPGLEVVRLQRGKRLNPIVVVAALVFFFLFLPLMKQKTRPKGRPEPCHYCPFNGIKQPV